MWPQITDGSEVSPNVSRAKIPSVKVQIERADNSSSEESNISAGIWERETIIVRL